MPSNRDPSLAGGKVYASRILSQVKDVVETEVDRTTVFDSDLENDILKFHSTELKLGKVIGRGGFCVVNELVGIQLLLGDDDDVSDMSQTSSLASLASICRRKFSRATTRFTTTPAEDDFDTRTRKTLSQAVGKARTAKYVVKKVEPKLLQKDPATYLKGTVDIALEAKYLAAMQHPNIIRIKALSAASADQEFGYFIVLDRMVDLLSKRLNDWMQRHRATQGMTGLITRGKRRSNELLVERLMVALDVSNALSYIHSRGVVYRDLKPDNVGFDINGVVKLFDFGLAKELDEEKKTAKGLYLMTGFTGGIRYMAPEVGLNKPYNNKVDVYSWSMVFWYMLALEPPFGLYTNNMFLERVFQKHTRPAIYQRWPQPLRDLLQSSWSRKIHERPSFDEISSLLRQEISILDPIVCQSLKENAISHDSQTDVTVEC